MKNTRKKITSLLLSLAILGSSFIASYAVSTNESPVYKDDNVNVVVEEKYDKESNTLELDLKLETLNDETEIESIVFPKTEEEKAADLLKEPEEVTERHEYKYEVTENGDYKFTVNYYLTVPTQSSNDNRSVNEQTENSSTVETEEGAEDPEPEPVAEGEDQAEAEPETLSTSVIPQTFEFTVKVDKIKDLTEPETPEVAEPETPSEEVDPIEDDSIIDDETTPIIEDEKDPAEDENKPSEDENKPEDAKDPVIDNFDEPTPRAGEKITANFNGAEFGPNSEYIVVKSDFEGTTARSLNIEAEFPSDLKVKRLEIEMDYTTSIVTAPGMVKKNGTLVFDASTLPNQLDGVITNATFTHSPSLTPDYDGGNYSGKLVYEISENTSRVNLSLLLDIRIGVMFNDGNGVSFTDPIKYLLILKIR